MRESRLSAVRWQWREAMPALIPRGSAQRPTTGRTDRKSGDDAIHAAIKAAPASPVIARGSDSAQSEVVDNANSSGVSNERA